MKHPHSPRLSVLLPLLLAAGAAHAQDSGQPMACGTLDTPPNLTGGNAAPAVMPALQSWTGGKGQWQVTSASKIVVESANATTLQPIATQLQADLKESTGITLPIVTGSAAQSGAVNLSLVPCGTTSATQLGNEGYTLSVQGGAVLRANKPAGVFYATRTLLQMLALDGQAPKAHKQVASGYAADYPRYAVRSALLDVGSLFMTKAFLEDYIRFMSWYKLNTLHLHLNEETPRGSTYTQAALRVISPKYPNLKPMDGDPNGTTGAAMKGYTKDDWAEMEKVAAQYGVEIQPEFDTPGHSAIFLRDQPTLAAGDSSPTIKNSKVNLDPTNPKTLPYIQGVFDEFLPWFHAKDIMIGGDEAGVSGEGNYLYALANHVTATTTPDGAPRSVSIWNDGYDSTSNLAKLNSSITIQNWNGSDGTFYNTYKVSKVLDSSDAWYVVPNGNNNNSVGQANTLYNWNPGAPVVGGQICEWNDNAVISSLTQDGIHQAFKDLVPAAGLMFWKGRVSGSDGKTVPYASLMQALPTLGYGPGVTQLPGALSSPPAAPAPVAYEADSPNNTLSGGAQVVSQNCVNCTDGSRVGYMGSLTFNKISVPASGTYKVAVNFGNGSGGKVSANLSFDGGAPVNVSFPPTGSWGTISSLTVVGRFVKGGANTLAITPDSSGTKPPDLDGIGTPALQ
ncbi:family 20 glycosylhydrolase [Burkholderia alba]|uniref:family 20 glycosylhydrolase n=1 Tax=Burkholderia alba TaxID=2683677 RepID=UPI002B0581E1|nr:family 20 glycosylhydrolase [Burkholderia alba]